MGALDETFPPLIFNNTVLNERDRVDAGGPDDDEHGDVMVKAVRLLEEDCRKLRAEKCVHAANCWMSLFPGCRLFVFPTLSMDPKYVVVDEGKRMLYVTL